MQLLCLTSLHVSVEKTAVEKQEQDSADFDIFLAFPVTFGPQYSLLFINYVVFKS